LETIFQEKFAKVVQLQSLDVIHAKMKKLA